MTRGTGDTVVRNWATLGLTFCSATLAGCSAIYGPGDCAGVGHPPPVSVTVRDQFGRPQALGSVATFIAGATQARDSTLTDSLTILGGSGGQTFDILISKRYYATTTLHGVKVPSGGFCDYHYQSVTVPAVITVLDGAPTVRSLYLVANNTLLDHGRDATVGLFVDASPGAPSGVRWSITGDTAWMVFDPATLTASYVCHVQSGHATLTARALADSTLRDSVAFAIQGHPASSTDPPCP